MLAKTLLALFAATAVAANPVAHDDRAVSIEDRADIEGRALCAGNLIDGPRKLSIGGTLRVYYSSAGGGTNCAYVTNDLGKEVFMYISLQDTSSSAFRLDDDYGDFSQFAGAVKLDGMAKHCFQVLVGIDGKTWMSRKDWHCGGGKVA
ncbi:hypothetical protein CcaverHIS002_0105900 [Cutaneotrichosporon cavernicola]|nr:hypothetical protein CcaverHIS002_0105900 [Cutaneotrichosporon cavernicola]